MRQERVSTCLIFVQGLVMSPYPGNHDEKKKYSPVTCEPG